MRSSLVNTAPALIVSVALAVTWTAAGCHPYPVVSAGTATVASGPPVPPSGLDTRAVVELPNGLRLVLEENHAAPVVALQAWVHAGGADDPQGQEGLAHLFQHLLLLSTKTRPAGQVARDVAAVGGRLGAFTTFDQTVYDVVVAAPFVDFGVALLADVLTQPPLTPADIETARRAAKDDLRQSRASPERVAAEVAMTTAFASHPYGRSLLGTDATLAGLQPDQIRRFFDRYYVAANTTLVIVGDFDAAVVRAQIAAAFGAMPAGGRAPARPRPHEFSAPQVGVFTSEVAAPQVVVAFRIPDAAGKDAPALELLAAILGPGRGGRLEMEIVRNRQLATGPRAHLFNGRDGGLLITTATLGPGRVDEAVRAIRDEVARLARERVGSDELARARAIVEGDGAAQKAGLAGYARKLGWSMSVAEDPAFESTYLHRLGKIDSDDLMAAAARIAQPANMIIDVVLPAARDPQRDDRAAKLIPRLRAVAAAPDASAVSVAATGPVSASGHDVIDYLLPSGVRLLVLRDDTAAQVSVRAVWSGGVRFEDTRLGGATAILARLLPRATKTRSPDQLAQELADVSGHLDGSAAMDSLALRGDFLAARWERGLDLLLDCVRNPRLSDEEIERERRVLLDAIRTRDDDPTELALRLFQGALFGRHPYRQDLLGTADSVAGLSRRRLLDHYRHYYGLRGLTIAVLGGVEPAKVMAKVQALLADVPAPVGERDLPPIAAAPEASEPREVFQLISKAQARIVIGYPGVTLRDPDRFALEVLAEILSAHGESAAAGSRSALPDQPGQTGPIEVVSQVGVDPGFFAVYVAARPDAVETMVPTLRAQLQRVAEGTVVTDQDLWRARRILIGTRALALERRGAVAMAVALHGAFGESGRSYRRDIEELSKVSLADVARVARRIIDPRREVLAVVRPRTTDSTVTSMLTPPARYTSR